MTSEEAYTLLTNRNKCREEDCPVGGCDGCDYQWDASKEGEADRMAIAALEKQIAKKPIGTSRYAGMKCNCGKSVFLHMTYCDSCGQMLDWSKDD